MIDSCSLNVSFRRRIYEKLTYLMFTGRTVRKDSIVGGNVLVVAQNRLMFDYVKELWKIFSDVVGDVHGMCHVPRELASEANALGLECVSGWYAKTRSFDAILLAEHAPSAYDPYAKRVIVPHGPVRSRPVRGWSYYYELNRIYWLDGRPVYALMFDNSPVAVCEALKHVPSYKGRIKFGGDLRSAELVENSQSLSLASSPCVAVMSTWGPHGLVEQYGDWIFDEIRRCAFEDGIQFVVTVHPNIWACRKVSRDWSTVLASLGKVPGVRVLEPYHDWAREFARCTMGVTDHTSLSASFAAAGKALIPVSVPKSQIGKGTFFESLCQKVKPVETRGGLRRAIMQMRREGMPNDWAEIVEGLLPDLSSSKERIAKELRALFSID